MFFQDNHPLKAVGLQMLGNLEINVASKLLYPNCRPFRSLEIILVPWAV